MACRGSQERVVHRPSSSPLWHLVMISSSWMDCQTDRSLSNRFHADVHRPPMISSMISVISRHLRSHNDVHRHIHIHIHIHIHRHIHIHGLAVPTKSSRILKKSRGAQLKAIVPRCIFFATSCTRGLGASKADKDTDFKSSAVNSPLLRQHFTEGSS